MTHPLLTGTAYVFVGGSGQSSSDGWNAMAEALGVPLSSVYWVDDPDREHPWGLDLFSVDSRMPGLYAKLMEAYASGATQIHIVAHSEGSAAVVRMLHDWLNGTSALPIEVAHCISSISLIGVPYGGTLDRDWFVAGYKDEWATNLPAKLGGNGDLSHIRLLNVYHKASIVQDRSLRGWGKRSQSVDTRSWWHRAAVTAGDCIAPGSRTVDEIAHFNEYHGKLYRNGDVIEKVAAHVGG